MKKLFREFKTFIAKGNVTDMAVGIIIGAAFKAIVDSLVNDVISPVIGLFANTNLSALSAQIGGVTIGYGSFLTAVINFLIMALVLFLLLKGLNSMQSLGGRFAKNKEEAPAPTTKTCPFCKSEISLEATRCPHCTSQLERE